MAQKELQSGMRAQTEAVEKAQQSPEVQRVLGAPVGRVPGSGQPSYQNRNGNAELKMRMKLRGPNGEADYLVHAIRRSGQEDWEFLRLTLVPERGEPVEVIEPSMDSDWGADEGVEVDPDPDPLPSEPRVPRAPRPPAPPAPPEPPTQRP
jgi:hypothetical protein